MKLCPVIYVNENELHCVTSSWNVCHVYRVYSNPVELRPQEALHSAEWKVLVPAPPTFVLCEWEIPPPTLAVLIGTHSICSVLFPAFNEKSACNSLSVYHRPLTVVSCCLKTLI
jgi:hypothetical protein